MQLARAAFIYVAFFKVCYPIAMLGAVLPDPIVVAAVWRRSGIEVMSGKIV